MHQKQGKTAEDRVAEHLQARGYKVICQNWKLRSAEIDIIAQRKDELAFVEVKYRRSKTTGVGHEYIGAEKLHRMRRSATLFLAANDRYSKHQPVLVVASVEGLGFEIELFDVV